MREEIVGLNLSGEGKVSTPTVSTLQSMQLVCCTNLIISAIDISDGHIHTPDTVTSQWERAGGGLFTCQLPKMLFRVSWAAQSSLALGLNIKITMESISTLFSLSAETAIS